MSHIPTADAPGVPVLYGKIDSPDVEHFIHMLGIQLRSVMPPEQLAVVADAAHAVRVYTASGCTAIYGSPGVTLSKEQQQQAFLAAQESDPQLQLRFTDGGVVHIWGPGARHQVLSAPGPRPQALAAMMMSETRLCIVGQGKLPLSVAAGAQKQQQDGLTVRILLRGTHDTLVAPLYLSGSSGGMWLGYATLLEGLEVRARFLHVQDGSWWSPLTEICSYRWVINISYRILPANHMLAV